jgi:2,4-dienoyl-CoA reductase-like NADH-dependent reductase (Old Yellow Enzyme family)
MSCFETLFSPFTIGNLRLKNRILMAPMGNNFSHPDGTVSDRAIAYYAARALGGAGLIITETSPVSLPGRHRTRGICAYDDSFLPGLQRLTDAVHGQGGAMALQLHHAGRLADPGITGVPAQAPSPIPRTAGGPIPKEMSPDEIEATIADFAAAAFRAKRAGFDAVEVHGAHGYLIHQFLSPRLNHRKDSYGGSAENRGRLALEVLRRVRKEVGRAFPVIFRLSAQEYVEGGYPLEEAVDWAIEAERAGASALHISGGTTESLPGAGDSSHGLSGGISSSIGGSRQATCADSGNRGRPPGKPGGGRTSFARRPGRPNRGRQSFSLRPQLAPQGPPGGSGSNPPLRGL